MAHTRCVCACLGHAWLSLVHTMQHTNCTYSVNQNGLKEMKLIKQYKSSEISTVIFYEANYLRDNWFDVCYVMCDRPTGRSNRHSVRFEWLADRAIAASWYGARSFFGFKVIGAITIIFPYRKQNIEILAHGLKTKVKKIHRWSGEKITINWHLRTDRLHLLSLTLFRLAVGCYDIKHNNNLLVSPFHHRIKSIKMCKFANIMTKAQRSGICGDRRRPD